MSTDTPAWLDNSDWREQAKQLFDRLPENQRRWFAGLVSLQIGWGGIERVCELFDVHDGTVRIGRGELRSGLENHPAARVRRTGAGRKPIEEVDPKAEEALLKLVEPETAGDPCSSQKWVRRTPRKLAEALKKKGHKISRQTVRRLLKKRGIRCGATENASRGRPTPTGTSSSAT